MHPGELDARMLLYCTLENSMATNKVTTQKSTTTVISRRRQFFISGLAVRVLIALVISWLIIMAFFVTGAVSH